MRNASAHYQYSSHFRLIAARQFLRSMGLLRQSGRRRHGKQLPVGGDEVGLRRPGTQPSKNMLQRVLQPQPHLLRQRFDTDPYRYESVSIRPCLDRTRKSSSFFGVKTAINWGISSVPAHSGGLVSDSLPRLSQATVNSPPPPSRLFKKLLELRRDFHIITSMYISTYNRRSKPHAFPQARRYPVTPHRPLHEKALIWVESVRFVKIRAKLITVRCQDISND